MTDRDTRYVQAEEYAKASAAAADDARTLLAELAEDGYRHQDLDAAYCALNVAIRHLQIHRRRGLRPVPDLPA